jgi:chromosome segregation ATPase
MNNLKKSLQDAQAISEAREKQIAEVRQLNDVFSFSSAGLIANAPLLVRCLQLLSEKEEHLKQINTLLLPKQDGAVGPDEDAILKSPAYIDLSTKLGTAERRVQELEAKYESTRQRWAVTKGDLDLAKKTIEEMEGKHERRWNELLSQFSESDSPDANGSTDVFGSAKKIAELESKLQQSMEAVNRVETLKVTLSESHKMNEALQSKLEDLKTKNAKMITEKSAARAAQGESLTSPTAASSSSKRASTGSAGGDNEKLQQSYKRVRKELAAAVMSKDQAKLKQEVRFDSLSANIKQLTSSLTNLLSLLRI